MSEGTKKELVAAKKIAEEVYGENPPPEIVAAILNAMTAEKLNGRLEAMTDDLCRAAAVAAGN